MSEATVTTEATLVTKPIPNFLKKSAAGLKSLNSLSCNEAGVCQFKEPPCAGCVANPSPRASFATQLDDLGIPDAPSWTEVFASWVGWGLIAGVAGFAVYGLIKLHLATEAVQDKAQSLERQVQQLQQSCPSFAPRDTISLVLASAMPTNGKGYGGAV